MSEVQEDAAGTNNETVRHYLGWVVRPTFQRQDFLHAALLLTRAPRRSLSDLGDLVPCTSRERIMGTLSPRSFALHLFVHDLQGSPRMPRQTGRKSSMERSKLIGCCRWCHHVQLHLHMRFHIKGDSERQLYQAFYNKK